MGQKVGSRLIGPDARRRRFIECSQVLDHRDEGHGCVGAVIGAVGGGDLTQPRRVDPYRHRGVRHQGMLFTLGVRGAVVDRCVSVRVCVCV